MSRTLKLLKKAAQKKEELTEQIESDFQNLEVSDIRKKLFEKIKERQSASAKVNPIDLSGIGKKTETLEPPYKEPAEIFTAKLQDGYEAKLRTLELENKKITKLQEETLKEIDALRSKLEEKDKTISELQSKAAEDPEQLKKEKEKAVANVESLRSKLYASAKETKEQQERISQLEEILKNREKRLADSDKHFKRVEAERDGLGEKLASADNRVKELEDKLSHLESEIASKDKLLEESDRAHSKNIDMAKKELTLQMQALEREKRSLEGKISQLNIEIEAKDKRLDESEGSYKELEEAIKDVTIKTELAKKELVLQIEATDREKKKLERKITQLNVEIEAKNNRLDDSEKAYRALDNLIKDAALKLEASESRTKDLEEKMAQVNRDIEKAENARQSDKITYEENMSKLKAQTDALNAAIAEKEKAELELRETLSRLELEIEERDKKIQTDIKYCESIVKEVNDLRQKMKALRLKIR